MLTLFDFVRKVAAGKYLAAPPALADGDEHEILLASDASIVTSSSTSSITKVEGAEAHDSPATKNPVRTGLRAYAEGAFPVAVSLAGDVVDAIADMYGRIHTNISAVRGTSVVEGGVSGLLGVGGSIADDSVDTAYPVKVGAVAAADPTLSTISAAGDRAHLISDLNRRLWVVDKNDDSTSRSNRVFEVSPLNLQVVEESLLDVTNHAASAGVSYPADDGISFTGYKGLSITGKFICGAADTVTMYLQVSNDEDVIPANRTWINLCGIRGDVFGDYTPNVIFCPSSTTVTYAWRFDNLNYRYVRIRLVVVGGASNTIEIKARRIY